MSRVGKIVTVKILEKYAPQQWQPKLFTGLVLLENDKEIQILERRGSKVSISLREIFEIQEEN